MISIWSPSDDSQKKVDLQKQVMMLQKFDNFAEFAHGLLLRVKIT